MACGEYGENKIEKMVTATENGKSLSWYDNPMELTVPKYPGLRRDVIENGRKNESLQETSTWNQIKVLMHRGYIKVKRDSVSLLNYKKIKIELLQIVPVLYLLLFLFADIDLP